MNGGFPPIHILHKGSGKKLNITNILKTHNSAKKFIEPVSASVQSITPTESTKTIYFYSIKL